MTALAKNYQQRFSSVAEFAKALEQTSQATQQHDQKAVATPARPPISSSHHDQAVPPKKRNPASIHPRSPSPVRRVLQIRLDVAQLTDVGRKRSSNQDNMAYVIPRDALVMAKKGALFIVANGIHEFPAGEVASEIAVETISSAYYQNDNEDVTASLLHAIKRANALIHQRAVENMLRSGMRTTCVAAVLRGGTAYIANIGNSRAYLIRAGQVRQVSQDHSWVEEQLRAELLTRDQARYHAQRNVITRSLGGQSDVDADIFAEQVFEGDTLLLCSDGLYSQVSDDDLRNIIGQYTPQESVYRLVERANENGGPDNITAIVIRVLEPGWDSYPVPVG